MTPISQMVVGLPMAAALGLFFGLSACTLSCLPYLAPLFLAAEGGIRASWRILLPFSLGRLCSYGALGAAAGAAGRYLGEAPAGGVVHWVSGFAALLIGIALILRPRARCPAKPAASTVRRYDSTPLVPTGLILLGAGMALTPCAPLGVVLFSAAMIGSAARGLALGLSFGLGAIVIPSLIYGVGVAYLGARLREQLRGWQYPIQMLSGLVLIGTGLAGVYA